MSQDCEKCIINKVCNQNGRLTGVPQYPMTLEDEIKWAKLHGYDCIVQCPKCGRTQYLEFKNGLKNGWSKCCGEFTMPIIWQDANIEKAVSNIVGKEN